MAEVSAFSRRGLSFYRWTVLGVAVMVAICAVGAWRQYRTSGRFDPLYAIIAVWGVSYVIYQWRRREVATLNKNRIAQTRFGVAFKDLTPNKQAAIDNPKPFDLDPNRIAGFLPTTVIWVAILFAAVLALAAYRELAPAAATPKQSLPAGREDKGSLQTAVQSGRAFWPSEGKTSQPRIPGSELELDNVRLSSEYGNYSISGRVANKSAQYTLKETDLLVTAQDCQGQPSHCTTIGQASAVLYIDVPPGQARDFSTSVPFSSPLRPRGQLHWSYTVRRTSAILEETPPLQGEHNASTEVAERKN